MAASSVNNVVIDVEDNESLERLKIHVVPLVWYIGNGTEGMQKMREEFEAGNEGAAIHAQVRLLANPCTIRERRPNGEIAASSVVFVVKGNKVAQRLVKKGIRAAGVWYRVEVYTNVGPESRCELFAVDAVTLRTNAAGNPPVATAQVITGQAITAATRLYGHVRLPLAA